jgi:light-regulated signal transduction histidine kinase (bacteriophytochrome)
MVRGNLRSLALGAGRSLPHGRIRMLRVDGQVIDVEAAAATIELGGRTLVQTEMRDITRELRALADVRTLNSNLEQRIAERTSALTEANRNLEAANRNLESFSYSVAHDLRAPLRRMTGYAQMLALDLREGIQAGVAGHVEAIVDNASKMTSMIDGLLDIARASHGKLEQRRLDLPRVVDEVLTDQQACSRARVAVGRLPAILGDAAAIRQVWANLISNALKYSAKRPHPEIDIACEIGASEAVFHVHDNGAGFDPDYSGKLFGVFQRLHVAKDFEGTGVGLAIVRRIVERHGGRVWAEGAPDAGATFYFALPAEIVECA